jgi:hypothetical protein
MSNIIKTIGIESAYTKSHETIEDLINNRDERTTLWETKINEHICDIERSYTISRMDGRQACGKDDSGNSAITVYGSSYY